MAYENNRMFARLQSERNRAARQRIACQIVQHSRDTYALALNMRERRCPIRGNLEDAVKAAEQTARELCR